MRRLRAYGLAIALTWAGAGLRAQDSARVLPAPDSLPPVADTVTEAEVASDAETFSQDTAAIPAPTSVLPHFPDTALARWQADPDYAYANDPAYWKKDPPPQPGWFQQFLYWLNRHSAMRILAFILIGIAVLAIAWRLFRENGIDLFRRRDGRRGNAQEAADARTNVDFNREIDARVAAGDWSGAVRFQYLRLLRLAADASLIVLADSATVESFEPAFADPAQRSRFRYLTSAYEHVVFGDFPVSEVLYRGLENRFAEFNRNISA